MPDSSNNVGDNGASPSRRKRGAPLGNRNALKHGFYSPRFKTREVADLENLRSGLQDEIDMLRVYTRRVFEMAAAVEDIDRASAILNALGTAVHRLSGLLRTQHLLTGESDSELQAAINQALAEVTAEMGLARKN